MIAFYIFLVLASVAFSTPLNDSKPGTEKSTTVAEQKCKEYTKNSLASTVPTSSDPKSRKELAHMARIGYTRKSKKSYLCGGTLISEYFVLSGGTCTSEKAEYILLGSYNQDPTLDPSSKEFGIAQTYVHPGYKPSSPQNDIALFKLDKKVEFNEHIKPICLNVKPDLSFQKATISGWGSLTFRGDKSEVLKIVDQQIHPQKTCADIYNANLAKFNSSTMICAGPVEENKDACQGDSGGPLQVTGEANTYLQIGIVSYGKGCGKIDTPGVYTKVSSYIGWIESIVWP